MENTPRRPPGQGVALAVLVLAAAAGWYAWQAARPGPEMPGKGAPAASGGAAVAPAPGAGAGQAPDPDPQPAPNLETRNQVSLLRLAHPFVGHPAPAFTWTDLDGEKVTVQEFRGRPAILNFWTTW